MSGVPRKEIPPPKGDDDFEDLVLALFRTIWKDPNSKLHGRSGQGQHGIDLYGEDRVGGTGLNGVQCKQHGSATFIKDKDLVMELRTEVEKAKGFKPPLQRFLFATTARRSATLDQEARDLTEQHKKEGLFAVAVLGWEDIENLLREHPDVLAWYLDERSRDHPRVGKGALALWREKLDFLLEQEALAVDAAQIFTLRKRIEEAQKKIQELGG
jgi:hypothetical protein